MTTYIFNKKSSIINEKCCTPIYYRTYDSQLQLLIKTANFLIMYFCQHFSFALDYRFLQISYQALRKLFQEEFPFPP